ATARTSAARIAATADVTAGVTAAGASATRIAAGTARVAARRVVALADAQPEADLLGRPGADLDRDDVPIPSRQGKAHLLVGGGPFGDAQAGLQADRQRGDGSEPRGWREGGVLDQGGTGVTAVRRSAIDEGGREERQMGRREPVLERLETRAEGTGRHGV